ncbi:MAG: DUF3800 domain-containing protein [Chloroflexota bacterium]
MAPLVFIDESGDPGLKCGAGSTEYFVVVAVVFSDHNQAKMADERIDQLRRELGADADFEFRFNACRHRYRAAFCEALGSCDFTYYAIVIDKARLTGEGFKSKEPFYKFASSLVFENAKECLNRATVIIDGSGSKVFRRQLAAYLRKRVNDEERRYISEIKIEKSARNNLVQLADMIAGAVHRSYGEKNNAGVYRRALRWREKRVQLWPK